MTNTTQRGPLPQTPVTPARANPPRRAFAAPAKGGRATHPATASVNPHLAATGGSPRRPDDAQGMATHNTPVGATATPSETAPTGATTRAKMKVTTRQCEVLRYARLEMTDKQIAVAMRIKPSSVATHWRDIYARLGVRRRAAALCRCYELGILK